MALFIKLNLLIITCGLIFCNRAKTDRYLKDTTDIVKLDTFIITNYLQDAKLLYLNEIISDSSHINYYNSHLDTSEITKILKIIQAVYNLHSTETNLFFRYPGIHGRYCYSFNSIELNVNPDLPEIQNLAKGIIPTGNSDLDDLLMKYHLDSVRTSNNFPNIPWVTLYSNNEYNMIPIEKELNDLPQIILAEFDKGCVGDGNTISLTRNNDFAILTFITGSGDCPSGCIYHKYWEFKVVGDKAEFIRTYGNDGMEKIELR